MNLVKLFKEKNKPNQKVISAIKKMLEDAESGKIQAFAGVELNGNNINHFQAGDVRDNYLIFIGMLFDLQIDLKHDYEEMFL